MEEQASIGSVIITLLTVLYSSLKLKEEAPCN